MDKIELLSEDASLPPERLIPRLNALSYLTLSVVECPEIRVQLDGSLAPVSLDLAWCVCCMMRVCVCVCLCVLGSCLSPESPENL